MLLDEKAALPFKDAGFPFMNQNFEHTHSPHHTSKTSFHFRIVVQCHARIRTRGRGCPKHVQSVQQDDVCEMLLTCAATATSITTHAKVTEVFDVH
ncbi:hypothetical protein CDAR_433451 [Caerostris darwini]|uniref:Uncharacterized protein n=1 Tax=Caerostris darwini TaxID=1538125 RepID=A0AAV4WD43_9ARAC|nr:hypothetical protein CDAR_433451 [Caerostris darwini]